MGAGKQEKPTPGLEPGTPSLRGKENLSCRVRLRAVEDNKVLDVVRIAEDSSEQEKPSMVTAMYVVSTSRTTTKI
jgi:hypothetical protein